jgi:hypothetical protein
MKSSVFCATFLSPVAVFATICKSYATHKHSYFLYVLLAIGKTGEIDHPKPEQIDHLYRSKLTTPFRSKVITFAGAK